jgi:hypothetical protein
MTDACDDPTALANTPGLKSACDCKKSVDEITRALDDYEEQQNTYKNDLESYRRYQKLHDDWQNKRGNYAQYKNYGSKNPFRIEWGWSGDDTNQLCKDCANGKSIGSERHCYSTADNRLGANGYNDTARNGDWGWHAGWIGTRKFWTCEKSDQQIAIENQQYTQYEPNSDGNTVWKGLAEPQKPSFNANINVQCCSQIFSDIQAETVSIEDAKVNCAQNINDKIDNAATGIPSEAGSGTPSTSPSSSNAILNKIKTTLNISDNMVIPVIVVVIVLCIISCCMVSMLLFLGSGSKKSYDNYDYDYGYGY